jgi:predicted phage tail protein
MSRQKPQGFAPTGSGIGKKKTKKPVTETDSGHSGSYLEVLTILSEGEIEGLQNGARDLYLDGTPIQNEDGTLNFSGFQYEIRTGTPDQTRIPGYSDEVSSETQIGATITQPIPVTRQIINPNLDRIRVRIAVQLQEFPDDGGVKGSNVAFRISVREGSNPWVVRLEETISGRYSSPTEFDYDFVVDNRRGLENTFQVRIERLTPEDVDTTKHQRILRWQAYAEVIEAKLSYRNTAVLAARFDAEQFSSEPRFEAIAAGGLFQIPSNAFVNPTDRGLDYVGIWDGTFKKAPLACTCPAWQLYDLLTHERFGLGKDIHPGQLNRWDFSVISRFCNAMVPDGRGGQERRFAANILLEGKEDALRVIEAYRSIFRGFGFWIQGQMRFISDETIPYTQIISQADLVEGSFSYSRVARSGRHSVFLVTYVNPDEFYSTAVEPVVFRDLIDLYGVKTFEMSAFACHSRGQAYRAGRAAGLSEKLEYETLTMRIRARGKAFYPGQVIKVANPKRANDRLSGLIKSATTTSIETDFPVNISAAPQLLSISWPDGTIQERSLINGPGPTNSLVFSAPLPTAPEPAQTWLLTSLDLDSELFRVLNRIPVSGSTETIHEIVAIRHEPLKQAAIEEEIILPERQIRREQIQIPTQPLNVQVANSYSGGSFSLSISWSAPLLANGGRDPFITSFLTEYKEGEFGQWVSSQQVPSTFIEYQGLPTGTFFVRVASSDIRGNSSAWVTVGPIVLSVQDVGRGMSLMKGSMMDLCCGSWMSGCFILDGETYPNWYGSNLIHT